MHLREYKTKLRLFVVTSLASPLPAVRREILSGEAAVTFSCPLAHCLHLLTLVPDVWALNAWLH